MYEMLYCKKKAHFFAFHNGKFTHPSIIHKKRMMHYGVKYFLEVCFSENYSPYNLGTKATEANKSLKTDANGAH